MPGTPASDYALDTRVEMLGQADRIGAVEPCGLADLIAVVGDLIADITELERTRFVMTEGQVVPNDFSPHRGEGLHLDSGN